MKSKFGAFAAEKLNSSFLSSLKHQTPRGVAQRERPWSIVFFSQTYTGFCQEGWMWEVVLVLGGQFLEWSPSFPPPLSSSSPLFYPSVRGPHILRATASRGASHGKSTGPLPTLNNKHSAPLHHCFFLKASEQTLERCRRRTNCCFFCVFFFCHDLLMRGAFGGVGVRLEEGGLFLFWCSASLFLAPRETPVKMLQWRLLVAAEICVICHF